MSHIHDAEAFGVLRRRTQQGGNETASDDPSPQFCSVSDFSTLPNAVVGTPPVLGLLFTVTPFVDLEIVALQLDVSDEAAAQISAANAAHVEVHTMEGEFLLPDSLRTYDNDPSHWTSIFQSDAVLVPHPPQKSSGDDDGASDSGSTVVGASTGVKPSRLLLPAQKFVPTLLRSGTTHSLYVSMKGHYMNCVAQALQKTGEVAAQTDEMSVSVGAGLNATGFPSAIDPIIDPQFSGIIHYRKVKPARENGGSADDRTCVAKTVVAFDYIMNRELPEENDDLFSLAVETALDDFVSASAPLREASNEGRWLTVVTGDKVTQTMRQLYTGQCPSSWTSKDCPNVSYRTLVTISHSDEWEAAQVRYELYLGQEIVSSALQRTRFTIGSGAELEVSYIGQRSIESRIDMTLYLNQSQTLNPEQRTFLASATDAMLSASVDPSLVDNICVNFTSPEPRRNLQGYSGGDEFSVQLSGTIRGTRYEFFGYEEFSQTLQEAFSNEALDSVFKDAMERERLMPGVIISNREFQPFEDIQHLAVQVEAATGFSVASTNESGTSTRTAVLVGSLLSAVIVVTAVLSTLIVLYKKGKTVEKGIPLRNEKSKPKENQPSHASGANASTGSTAKANTFKHHEKQSNRHLPCKSPTRSQSLGCLKDSGIASPRSLQRTKSKERVVSFGEPASYGGAVPTSPRLRQSVSADWSRKTPSTPDTVTGSTRGRQNSSNQTPQGSPKLPVAPPLASPRRTKPSTSIRPSGSEPERVGPRSPKSPRRSNSDTSRLSAIGSGGPRSSTPQLAHGSPRTPQRAKSFNPIPCPSSSPNAGVHPRAPKRSASYNAAPSSPNARSDTKGTVIGSLPLRNGHESPRSPRRGLVTPVEVD